MVKTAQIVCLLLILTGSRISGQRITEVMYDPGIVSDYDLEWVEILNDTVDTVDFSGWALDGKDLSGIVPAGETLTVVRNLVDGEDSFESFYGDGSGVWGDDPMENYLVCESAISLLNSGEIVYLENSTGVMVHSAEYEPSMGGNGNDYTLTFYSDGTVMESGEIYGTPGTALHMIELEFSEPSPKKVMVSSSGGFYAEYSCGGSWKGYGFCDGFWDITVENIEEIVYEGEALVEGDDYHTFIETPEMDTYPLEVIFRNTEDQPVEQVFLEVTLGSETLFEGIYHAENPPFLYRGEYVLTCSVDGYLVRELDIEMDGEEFTVAMVRFSQLVVTEFSHSGECEWVELGLSCEDFPVLLDGVSIHDLAGGTMFPPGTVLYGRLAVTRDADVFHSVYPGCLCLELAGMPQLNDGGDLIELQMGGIARESLEYDSAWPSDCASLERISLSASPVMSNFYPAGKGSPGERNSAEDYMHENRELVLTEVYPFGSLDFIEVTVVDDGNNGEGCLVRDYTVSDMETETNVSADLCRTGDVILLETLSLYDYGDQVLLRRNGILTHAMAYRKQYSNLTVDERDDMARFEDTGYEIVEFKDIISTLSFQLVNGGWVLKGATAGNNESPDIVPVIIVEKRSRDSVLRIHVETKAAAEITVRVFDTGGFEKKYREYFLFGDAEIQLEHNFDKGLYIYVIKVVSNGSDFSRKGVFAVL